MLSGRPSHEENVGDYINHDLSTKLLKTKEYILASHWESDGEESFEISSFCHEVRDTMSKTVAAVDIWIGRPKNHNVASVPSKLGRSMSEALETGWATKAHSKEHIWHS